MRGENTDKKKYPFHKWCGLVGEIRSLLPQEVPLLALTATATTATRKKIMELFSFKQGIQIIVSPNRKNVKLVVKRNHQTGGELYNFFINTLQDKAYRPTSSLKKSANRMIAMYHSNNIKKIQQHVLSSLKYPHGSVRIIIATSALGRVINYGPPNNIDAYVQAFGRVGRVSLSWSSTSTL
ncbi:LOW QUALITY PROTEIN: probable ATP-dependent DNA helicase RecS [Pocillopora verrucosa]|uniref:LOW QUALITY PROTEIN: probable ATP-dependent DNA helicase RecS n=1 Tax=Pocillopora verrucosa TaxID=203993 RepID=UPI0033415750